MKHFIFAIICMLLFTGCVKCMTCIYQCPMKAIKMIPNVSAVIDPEKCVGCGRCFESCQPGAIVPYEHE